MHTARRALRWCMPFAAAALALVACDRGKDDDAAAQRAAATTRSGGVIQPAAAPYQEVAVTDGGSVQGSIVVSGDLPADTVVRPTSDQSACGAELTDETIRHVGDRLGDVVVWIADVRRGKALPVERRFEITNEGCQLVPRVQAAVAGGTLNVRNADAATHRTRFVAVGAAEPLALITQTEAGAVVPDEKILARPGQLEVRCDQHPWTRAAILVFDHPYFAVTEPDGTFRLDDIPPGRHRLMVWHERFGLREQEIVVESGKAVDVKVELKK